MDRTGKMGDFCQGCGIYQAPGLPAICAECERAEPEWQFLCRQALEAERFRRQDSADAWPRSIPFVYAGFALAVVAGFEKFTTLPDWAMVWIALVGGGVVAWAMSRRSKPLRDCATKARRVSWLANKHI